MFDDLFGDLDTPNHKHSMAQTDAGEPEINWKLILGGDGTMGNSTHTHGIKYNEAERRRTRRAWRTLPKNNTVRQEIKKAREFLRTLSPAERKVAKDEIIKLNRMIKFERSLKNVTRDIENGEDVEIAINKVKKMGEKIEPGIVAEAKAEVKAKAAAQDAQAAEKSALKAKAALKKAEHKAAKADIKAATAKNSAKSATKAVKKAEAKREERKAAAKPAAKPAAAKAAKPAAKPAA